MAGHERSSEEERSRLSHPCACASSQSRGRRIPESGDGIRTAFERDGHRIIHSKPFRRLRNKTQVFFSPENDHMATRMDHSLYVATIARTICRNLGINDDLAFAASLGHDLGHAPFGHSGEKILERLLNRHSPAERPLEYTHEAHSLRVVDLLSSLSGHDFIGLNLTYEVRDGIRCHCGESVSRTIEPRSSDDDRDPSTFTGRDTLPISLEGCVVRMADRIAYLGRDYEDAQVALSDTLPPLPPQVIERLGANNREIIATFVVDVIEQNRREEGSVGFSEEVFDAMLTLRRFNYENIYLHERLEEYRAKADVILTTIFEVLIRHLEARPVERWHVTEPGWPRHLAGLAHFIAGAGYPVMPAAEMVIADFISLMTDGYAFKIFKSIALPDPIV